MNSEELFMTRCLELASNGLGYVAPNPMTGCVIVHDGKIIGEGFHQKFGNAHAEVNAIHEAERKSGADVLKRSTLYVSLEPCNHFGKTPPCCDLILEKKINRIVIGCTDTSAEVNGKGIKRLKDSGCEVIVGVLEKECRELNKRFFTFHEKKRPYIILKYAQSKDGFIAPLTQKPPLTSNPKPQTPNSFPISNDYSRKLVHKWRSEEQAIMIGTNTALQDNPYLTVREWKGRNPVRVVIDRSLKISKNYNIFNSSAQTIVFNEMKNETANHVEYVKVDFGDKMINDILNHLAKRNLQSVIVEGGSRLLQSFIDQHLWDEARIFIGNKWLGDGVKAPVIKEFEIYSRENILDDQLTIMKNG